MITNNPFIVKFETKAGNQYIYDVTTNSIFPSSDITIKLLNNYKKMTKNELIESLCKIYPENEITLTYQKITKWINFEGAFFPPAKLKIGKMPTREEFLRSLTNLPHMILVPTNRCNLRCKYCAYSGEYSKNRVHNEIIMSWDIAKRVIDFFLSLVKSNKRTIIRSKGTIGFYGGEPLLQFKLIKQCMEYVKSIGCNELIYWNFTTNGTLLTEEIIKYFIQYDNIKIGISLDGPQNLHDRHRIFRNGIGSFKKIMKNLERIYCLNSDFYEKHIHFQPLLPKYNSPYDLVNFFSSHPLVCNNNISSQIGDISPGAKTFYNNLSKKDKKIFMTQYGNLFRELIDMLIKGDYKSRKFQLLTSLSANIFQKFDRRLFRSLQYLNFTTGTCLPGTRKLYIAPDGKFYICERVPENNAIGDCFNGIDYSKCKELYEKYIENVTSNCHDCTCIHFCTLCFASADHGEEYNNKEYCKSQQSSLKDKLSDYYSILEENPHIFEIIRSPKFDNRS